MKISITVHNERDISIIQKCYTISDNTPIGTQNTLVHKQSTHTRVYTESMYNIQAADNLTNPTQLDFE